MFRYRALSAALGRGASGSTAAHLLGRGRARTHLQGLRCAERGGVVDTAAVMTVGLACLVGAVAAAWLARVAFAVPKPVAGLVVLVTILSQSFQTISGVAAVGYADELCVLAALTLFCTWRLSHHGSLRWFGALWPFIGFGALGMISSVVHEVPLGTSLTGAFLFFKGPLLAFAVAQLDWRREDLRAVARWGGAVIVAILAMCVLNALSPETWHGIVGRTDTVSERGGFMSLSGPFDHPVGLGTTMSLSFVAVSAYRSLVRRTPVNLALMVGTGLACLMSFRRKSVVSAVAVAAGLRLAMPKPRAFYVVGAAILVPTAVIIGWDTLSGIVAGTITEYTADTNETARIRLTMDSIPLAIGAFPLGVGFGRFASFTAADDYSPLYEQLGYHWIWGMQPDGEESFLSDTFWPAPLAETGVLGLVCYAGGLLLLVMPAWRLMRGAADPHVRWIGAVGVGWFAVMGIESVAAPVFVSPPMYGLPFALAGLVLAVAADESARAAVKPLPWAAGAAASGQISRRIEVQNREEI